MKVVPLGANLVVKRLAAEEATVGGVLIPDAAQEKPQQGRVLSIGDGRLLKDGSRAAHEVAEGDRVLFNKYAGNEVAVDGEDMLILSEDDILAVMQ